MDCRAYELSYFCHMIIEELSSGSDSSSSSDDSDDNGCAFLYSTPGSGSRKEVIVYSPPIVARRDGGLLYGFGSELDMKGFSGDVQHYESSYHDKASVNFLRTKIFISSTWWKEDILLTPCFPGEKVCIHPPKGVKKMFHMYNAFS